MNKSVENNNHLIKIPKTYKANCDFCDSDKFEVLFKSKDYIFKKIPGEFTIVKCSKCNLVYINPRPIKEQFIEYYSEYINYGKEIEDINSFLIKSLLYSKEFLSDYFNYPFKKKKLFRKYLKFLYYIRIKKRYKTSLIVPSYIENGNILEIGCSFGNNLYRLKKLGWKVKGIELNNNAIKYARNKLNLDVEKVSIEEFQSERLFDIIYMYMVLEHVYSPKKVLEKCYSLLKPNGKLVFSVPDFSGIEVKIYKKFAYTFHTPYHLYNFTPKTIQNYLNIFNFKNTVIIHQNFDRDLIAPLKFILEENPEKTFFKILLLLMTSKLIRKTIIKIIINLLAFLGKTSRMTIITEK